MGRTNASPESYKTISDSEESEYTSPPPSKRARTSVKKRVVAKSTRRKDEPKDAIGDLEDGVWTIARPHGPEYHAVRDVAERQHALLEWFDNAREKRGMPWRKRYDPSQSVSEKGQRAYEIWVSEVMLQQTQVATVIEYWRRWMETWPTIADLAKADIEQVNAAWRGLGYYRRARSLLKGAQTVMGDPKYNGRLPKDPAVLERQIDGVGRYTAGAISSMAYGARAPIIDGNIHRLFTRLFAVHAPQADTATTKWLWKAAEELVEALPEEPGIAGDWNQALMELGSQVCKPVGPECSACPLRSGCKAFAELHEAPPPPSSETCDLCVPVPGDGAHIPSVAIFPMKKEKKASREENEVVCIVEWSDAGESDRKWLFTKRPDKGLLAGLFEPPTTPLAAESTVDDRLAACRDTVATVLGVSLAQLEPMITSERHFDAITHIFSHINMTYHIVHMSIASATLPHASGGGVWLDEKGVESANVGTGVKKVWKAVHGSWGRFEVATTSSRGQAKPKGKQTAAKKMTQTAATEDSSQKVVRKIMMPMMPRKHQVDAA